MSILVGFVLVLVNWFAKECVGLGTLFNMFFVGFSFDIYARLHLLAPSTALIPSIFYVLSGLTVIAVATFFYLSPQMGAGPRDGLMTVFTKKTKWPVGACRAIIEGTALLLGFLLGGQVGPGTLITVILIGPAIQLSFKIFRFDAKTVRHESLNETFRKNKDQNLVPCPADGPKIPGADPDKPAL
ncbi:hypothetical protein SDC9_150166 [bioreactor metagenome]|uniref:Membrane protein YczE n=1 Tax=bioreactor metagenome TaxID=1076179 RepID=A0A645ELQ8_9ZZZZ